jgi:hypothetical protein
MKLHKNIGHKQLITPFDSWIEGSKVRVSLILCDKTVCDQYLSITEIAFFNFKEDFGLGQLIIELVLSFKNTKKCSLKHSSLL